MSVNGDEALTDAEISREVAREAGQLLLALREETGPVDDRATADAMRARGDRTSHELIAARLATLRPADAVLSEEGKDDASRLDAERVWIVDPLDGTWEFGQGRADFAVHIALWEPGPGRLSAATVDLPAQGLTRSVLDVEPALPPLPSDRPLRIVASRSRPPATLPRVTEILAGLVADAGITAHGVEIVDVGSVGAKVNEILAGRAEAYVHDTGFFEWDVAAPAGVAAHYGLVVTHVDGAPHVYNAMPPYVTDLMVAHPDLADLLLQALRTAREEAQHP